MLYILTIYQFKWSEENLILSNISKLLILYSKINLVNAEVTYVTSKNGLSNYAHYIFWGLYFLQTLFPYFFIWLQWTEKAKVLASYSGSPHTCRRCVSGMRENLKGDIAEQHPFGSWVKLESFLPGERKEVIVGACRIAFEWGRELGVLYPHLQVFPQRKSDSPLMWGPEPAGRRSSSMSQRAQGRLQEIDQRVVTLSVTWK